MISWTIWQGVRLESWTIKKAEPRRTDAFKLWCWRRLLRVPWTVRRSNQSIIGRADAQAEAPIPWQPDVKSQLFGKDPDAGKDWGQEEKGATEDEIVEWHHRLNGHAAASAAKLLQSCLTLSNTMDCSLPGSSVHWIFQARVLEWVAISFSNAWKWKVKVKLLSRVWLFMTPRTAAYQAPLSMGFSRQEYWSGVPLPSLCWIIW